MNKSMSNQYYYEETEIDLIKLIYYVLHQWKVLLICTLIGAVIGASASMLGGMKSSDNSTPATGDKAYPQVGFLTPEEELDFGTDEEIAAVLGIVTDPAKLTEEQVDLKKVNQYVEYLNMYEDEIASEQRAGMADSEGNVIVKDPETASNLLSLRQSYKFKAADYKITNMSDYDIAYYEYKYGDREEAAKILENSAKLQIREQKELTLESKASSSGGILSQIADANKNEAAAMQSGSASPLQAFSLKKTILGAFVALFLAACWFAFKFILDKSIKDAEEIKRRYGLPLLGNISNVTARAGFDGFIDKLEHKNEVVNDREYVADAIKPVDCESMLLIGDTTDADTVDMMNWVATQDKRCTVSGFLTTEKDALAKVNACDGIILFVHIWKTTATELIHELETAGNMNKKVVGVVTIQ